MTEHKRSLPAIRTVCFLLIGVLLFLCVQSVLTLKWEYADTTPFRVLDSAGPAQVLLLGPSTIYSSIFPVDIYEQYGITTLDLASPGQQIQLSCDLLAETMKRWTPEAVVLEAGGLIAGSDPSLSMWLHVLTDTPFSAAKLRAAKTYSENVPIYSDVSRQTALLEALVPMYEFHDRWTQLTGNDFAPKVPGLSSVITKGGLVQDGVVPAVTSVEAMNAVAYAMEQEDDAMATYMTAGETMEADLEDIPIYNVQIDEYAIPAFNKIAELCRERQVPLLLIKIPDTVNPVSFPNSWTMQKHQVMQALAQQYEVPFLDLLYDVDLGLDWSNDSCDGGIHTNVRGARKISAYLGQYLKDTYQLAEIQDPSYEWAIPYFKLSESLAMEQTELDLSAWVDWIQNSGRDLTVAMAVCEDMSLGLTEENIQTLKNIGLQTDFGALSFGDTFLAVWEHSAGGTDYIPYEAASNRELTYKYKTADGADISLLSRGGYQYANISIKVNGNEQAVMSRGLHFVLYDRTSGLVLDEICVNFSTSGAVAHLHYDVYLRDFERWINDLAGAA